jgi:hypothetical protein
LRQGELIPRDAYVHQARHHQQNANEQNETYDGKKALDTVDGGTTHK